MTSEDPFSPLLSWSSERTLRIALGDAIGDEAHHRVRATLNSLMRAPIPGLIDVTPAYTTLVLTFDPRTLDDKSAESAVRRAIETSSEHLPPAEREVDIPVCYESGCAPDLADVASLHGTTIAEVVRVHSSASYTARILGFAPGFAYLAGLPRTIETPRLDRPRVRVPAGSVGIAGLQTGVYPRENPGGWRLIGRTPLRMFDAARAEPSLIKMGDRA